MKTEKRRIGDFGETQACLFLVKQGFDIVERNYLRKWGELDIIARKAGKLHFVEVKTVTRVNVSGVTNKDQYRPEDNLHPWKLKRLSRVIQTYLLSVTPETDWQFDVITVYLDPANKKAEIHYLPDIIL